jgi:tetratricopeptide (TPR) repeat protein
MPPPEPFAREYAADPYAGEVAYVDECLGKLFSFLEARGLMSSTLIVLTADHDESFGEHDEFTHGYFAYNSTLHVPLIFRADAILPPGKADRHMVSHIDVFPTICDLLHVKKPDALQGQSLLPLLEGSPFAEKPIYFECLIDPNLASAWNGKGAVLEMKADLEGAAEAWKKAISIDPKHEMALYNLGLVLLRLNRPAEALEPLENYLRVTGPNSPDRIKVSGLVRSIKQQR